MYVWFAFWFLITYIFVWYTYLDRNDQLTDSLNKRISMRYSFVYASTVFIIPYVKSNENPKQSKANKQTLCWLQPCNHLLSFYSSVHLSFSINFAHVFNLLDFCTYIVVYAYVRMCVHFSKHNDYNMCAMVEKFHAIQFHIHIRCKYMKNCLFATICKNWTSKWKQKPEVCGKVTKTNHPIQKRETIVNSDQHKVSIMHKK